MMVHRLLLLIVLLSAAVSIHHAFIFPISNQPSFPNVQKFININNYIFPSERQPKRIYGLTDMDNDKHVDLLVDGGSVFRWHSRNWQFELFHEQYWNQSGVTVSWMDTCDSDNCHIVTTDVNFDGYNDVLVQRTSEGQLYDVIDCFLYVGERNGRPTYQWAGLVANVSSGHEFSIFDNNSDMMVDIVGLDPDGELAVWENESSDDQVSFSKSSFTSRTSDRAIITPFVPVFADIDGDCHADMVLLTCDDQEGSFVEMSECEQPVIEFYINDNGRYKYEEPKDLPVPKGTGRLTISDMNRDGNLDIMFPVCYPYPSCEQRNEVQIIYNAQMPMCTSSWFPGSGCRLQTDLCTREPWSFGDVIDTIDLGYNKYLYSDQHVPPTLRVADWNMDGYPDVVAVVEYRNQPDVSKVEVWTNVHCTEALCDRQNGWSTSNRTFSVLSSGMSDVDELTHARAAFFMDLDESGTLDLFVVSNQLDGKNNDSHVHGFFNNFHPDAFFFKTMGLNGVTTHGGYGAIVPGFTFKLTISINDVTGGKVPRSESQFTSSSYMSLQTPYSFFGLGRTNSYIENFFIAPPVTDMMGTKYVKHEPGIIPNSQLICIPKPLSKPSKWEIQLFVSPTAHSVWVAVGVFLTLIIFGAPILVCWIIERRNDKRRMKKDQAIQNFL